MTFKEFTKEYEVENFPVQNEDSMNEIPMPEQEPPMHEEPMPPHMHHIHEAPHMHHPPHEMRPGMYVEFSDIEQALFCDIFGDEDTASAAMDIIRNAPPELQVMAKQLLDMIQEEK